MAKKSGGGMHEPQKRGRLRLMTGGAYFGARRRLLWLRMRDVFARTRQTEPLPYCAASHQTPLRRKLRDVEMWKQENKIVNLRLAAAKIDGLLLRPGEVFSFWRLVGRPSKAMGYLPAMVLSNGHFYAGTGGGLCQMTNLIFWMALHTPLRVVERHRHGYDVFPDADRTQPFGSGATCFYPYGDLMLRNDTQDTYQLLLRVGEDTLSGEWRVSAPPQCSYEVAERNHRFRAEYWGGYTRCNELYRRRFDQSGTLLEEELVIENAAVTMYSPLLSPQAETGQ